jgi:hypothetical protein
LQGASVSVIILPKPQKMELTPITDKAELDNMPLFSFFCNHFAERENACVDLSTVDLSTLLTNFTRYSKMNASEKKDMSRTV